jgi:hypothetical protein
VLVTWVKRIDGYGATAAPTPDPHVLATWVKKIDGYPPRLSPPICFTIRASRMGSGECRVGDTNFGFRGPWS